MKAMQVPVAEVLDCDTDWPRTAKVQWLLNPMLNGSLLYQEPWPQNIVPRWQPIDTAPKDNKRKLYLASFTSAGELTHLDFDGSWEKEQESWELPGFYWVWCSANGNVEEPTHWAYQDEVPPPELKNPDDYETMIKDAARYKWVLPILTGSDEALANKRTVLLANQLMLGLEGTAIVDAAMKAES